MSFLIARVRRCRLFLNNIEGLIGSLGSALEISFGGVNSPRPGGVILGLNRCVIFFYTERLQGRRLICQQGSLLRIGGEADVILLDRFFIIFCGQCCVARLERVAHYLVSVFSFLVGSLDLRVLLDELFALGLEKGMFNDEAAVVERQSNLFGGQQFAKAQLAAGQRLPRKGTVFLSVNDRDKKQLGALGKELSSLGFRLLATRGTAASLEAAGIEAESVFKVNEGRPNIVDLVKTGKIDLVINTPLGRESFYDEKSIRRAAIRYNIPCITTLAAAHAAARGIRALLEQGTEVAALQDLHRGQAAASGAPASGD